MPREISARLTEEETYRKLLVEELQHRLKNKTSTIHAVLHQVLHDQPQVWTSIDRRLRALAAADGERPGVIWLYNRRGHTSARLHPPALQAIDPRWRCDRVGDDMVGTLACWRASPASAARLGDHQDGDPKRQVGPA